MPTEQILGILIAERDRLNRAIEVLQGPAKRRGRPPKAADLSDMAPAAPARRRRARTAAQRRAQSEKMKKYWAARKKAKS